MDWFKKHLNWTWLIVSIPAYFVSFSIANLLSTQNEIMLFLGMVIFALILLPLNIWILKRKNNSLKWLWLASFLTPWIPMILPNNAGIWLRKHLNLTWLLGLFIVAYVAGGILHGSGLQTSSNPLNPAYFLCWVMLPLNGWLLKQKGRSLGWLWLCFFGFPWIPLVLSNKKPIKEYKAPVNMNPGNDITTIVQ